MAKDKLRNLQELTIQLVTLNETENLGLKLAEIRKKNTILEHHFNEVSSVMQSSIIVNEDDETGFIQIPFDFHLLLLFIYCIDL